MWCARARRERARASARLEVDIDEARRVREHEPAPPREEPHALEHVPAAHDALALADELLPAAEAIGGRAGRAVGAVVARGLDRRELDRRRLALEEPLGAQALVRVLLELAAVERAGLEQRGDDVRLGRRHVAQAREPAVGERERSEERVLLKGRGERGGAQLSFPRAA